MSKGADSNPVPFGGEVGKELDKIWQAIRADKIVGSPGVRVSRTTGGTFLKFADQIIDEDLPPTEPPATPPPNDWRISKQGATMPFKIYTHIEEFYGGTYNRTGRTMFCLGPDVATLKAGWGNPITVGKNVGTSFIPNLGGLGINGPPFNVFAPSQLTPFESVLYGVPKCFWIVPATTPKIATDYEYTHGRGWTPVIGDWFLQDRNRPGCPWPTLGMGMGGAAQSNCYVPWSEFLNDRGWNAGDILGTSCLQFSKGGFQSERLQKIMDCSCTYLSPESTPPDNLIYTRDSGLRERWRWCMVAIDQSSRNGSARTTWHGDPFPALGGMSAGPNPASFVNKWPEGALVLPHELTTPHVEDGQSLTHYMAAGPYGPDNLKWLPDPNNNGIPAWQIFEGFGSIHQASTFGQISMGLKSGAPVYQWRLEPIHYTGTPGPGMSHLFRARNANNEVYYPYGATPICEPGNCGAPWYPEKFYGQNYGYIK